MWILCHYCGHLKLKCVAMGWWALFRKYNDDTAVHTYQVVMHVFMQCELYHWIDVLNRFDAILEEAAVQKDDSAIQDETTPPQTECIFLCPQLNISEVKLHIRVPAV